MGHSFVYTATMKPTHPPTRNGGRLGSAEPTSTKSKAKRRPGKPKGTYVCAECGVTFTRWKSNVLKSAAPCCSRTCAGKAKRKAKEVPCAHCGRDVVRTQYSRKTYNDHFCSRRCHSLWSRVGSTNKGYRWITTDKGRVLEHRAVMEAHIGRELRPEEVVHHRNERRADNRIENLEIMSAEKHTAHHSPISWDPDVAVSLRKEGRTYSEISKVVGVTVATIRQGLKRRGLFKPSKMGRPRKWDTEKALAMRAEGASYRKIGKALGVTARAIFQGLKSDRAK